VYIGASGNKEFEKLYVFGGGGFLQCGAAVGIVCVFVNSRFQDFFDFAGVAAPGGLHQVILLADPQCDEKAINQQKIYFLPHTKTDGGVPAMSLIPLSTECTAPRTGNPPQAIFDANSFISVGWLIN